MAALVFEAVEPSLSRRVIPAVPLATYGADHAVLPQLVLEELPDVLAAPIRVLPQPHGRFPPEPRHRQRVRHDVRRHAGVQ